ncbi:MBL fold metallo-hydrolase [Natrarchaeobius chitinivorans]|uniref:MBL fold metallo-hydrolase n=1 Tax=Natrarchaeobius chitinivorans TaxID=1679083 RepID=UPI001FB1C1BF|nr:MBL fold metallo-hydrolase [Natrarchaeobius chitinivorans]
MRVSYQHANVKGGNESTVLRFTAGDGTPTCILVDVGDGVDVDSLLGDGEYLDAILLTHGHIDHYRTLARNVRCGVPIYTSPSTAMILEHALPEATKDNALGDVSAAIGALEPIDDWTSVLETIDVRPVSAGHTPGAAGFVIRFRDENATGLLDGEHHILVTGDFTTRPCAGYPGLPTSYPFDIDCLFVNVSSDDSYSRSLNDSVQTVLERAYAGSRVVVAASSLTGVHYVTLLGHATKTLERELPITLVGQAAKLYNALEYDVPGIDTCETFDRCETVLEAGGVTIAGPETPTTGSARRLFERISDDPAAVFVQSGTDDADRSSGTRCTVRTFPLCNHPSLETIDDLVESLVPTEVVIKHASGKTLNEFQRRFDRCFTWGTNDERVYRLYEDGQWQAPDWIADRTATRIRKRRWKAIQEQTFAFDATVPIGRSQDVDPAAEGVDLEALEAAFSQTASQKTPRQPTDGSDSATSTGQELEVRTEKPAERNRASPSFEVNDARSGAEADDRNRSAVDAPSERDGVRVPDEDAGSSEADGSREPAEAADRSLETEVLARLDRLEAKLDRSTETIRARVLSDGTDEQFVRLLEPTDLEAGDVVELTIETRSDDR